MKRRKPSADQPALALPCDPNGEDALRAAFAKSGLEREGYSFERAMNVPHVAISLRNVARSMVRR